MKKDRNEDGIPIKKALEGFYKAMGIDAKMNETRVLAQWEEIAGKAVAARTLSKTIREGILYLEINSSVMRAELVQKKEELIEKVNAMAGTELITDIYLK